MNTPVFPVYPKAGMRIGDEPLIFWTRINKDKGDKTLGIFVPAMGINCYDLHGRGFTCGVTKAQKKAIATLKKNNKNSEDTDEWVMFTSREPGKDWDGNSC